MGKLQGGPLLPGLLQFPKPNVLQDHGEPRLLRRPLLHHDTRPPASLEGQFGQVEVERRQGWGLLTGHSLVILRPPLEFKDGAFGSQRLDISLFDRSVCFTVFGDGEVVEIDLCQQCLKEILETYGLWKTPK